MCFIFVGFWFLHINQFYLLLCHLLNGDLLNYIFMTTDVRISYFDSFCGYPRCSTCILNLKWSKVYLYYLPEQGSYDVFMLLTLQ